MWGKVERDGARWAGRRGYVESFLGEHGVRLDDKGRLFLPSRWRPEFTEGLVITKGQERCLYVFTEQEFRVASDAIDSAPITSRRDRTYSRFFHASAFDQKPDRQGRVLVPATLREYASLDRDCTILGLKRRLEIWDTAAWQAFQDAEEASYADRDDDAEVSR